MIGDRERADLDDLTVVWFGNGVELARRMDALAEGFNMAGETRVAERIRDVLTCDHNPLPGPPELGDPPTKVNGEPL